MRNTPHFLFPIDLPKLPYCKSAYRQGYHAAWRKESSWGWQIHDATIRSAYDRGYSDGAALRSSLAPRSPR